VWESSVRQTSESPSGDWYL
jgi:hypothetical protein